MHHRLALLTILIAVANFTAPAASPSLLDRQHAPTSVAFTGESFRSAIENATFTIERFTDRNGKLVAVGMVSGDVFFVGGPCVDGSGSSARCHLYERSFAGVRFHWSVAAVSGSCSQIDVRLAQMGGTFDPRPWGDFWRFAATDVRLTDRAAAACAVAEAAGRDAGARRLALLLSRLV